MGPPEGPIVAGADPDLFDRLVWNLLGNAVKFSPRGGLVEVRLRYTNRGTEMEVADQGPGIPEEQLEKVFERFFRTDESRTPGEESSGTGLGLAIAKAIVELHQGEITAENRPEGGAVFRVLIPPHQQISLHIKGS